MDRRAAVAALGAAALGSALKGSVSPGPRLSVGRLKQSVSRWPYRQIPLPEFARAAVGMGLAAIDLLGPEDWDPVRERSEAHTSELQSQSNLVCRPLLEKKNKNFSFLHVRKTHTNKKIDICYSNIQ